MTPVSWVNQASFEPLGLTLAIPKTTSVTEEEVVEPEVSIDPELHLEEILKDHPSIRTRSLAFDIFSFVFWFLFPLVCLAWLLV